MGIWGQDWSSYQSAMPDTTGLSFAFVKITQGTGYVNPLWVSQRNHAKAAGLVFGGYHYPDMGHSVQAEADFFLSQVNWQPGDLVVLDWEGYDAINAAIPKADQARYKDGFLRYVKGKLPHNPVGLYANTDYWRNVDASSYYADFLWIATAGLPAGQPGITAPWLFHQYSASTVDKDYCHLASTQALRDWALSFQPTPPTEDDMTPTQAQQLADIHKAVVEASIASRVDGTMHTLSDHTSATNAVTIQTHAEVAALQATVAALAKGGNLTADEITAAAKAGAAAALAELGTALGKAGA